MVVINILGLLLIGFIVWWFWLYKQSEVSAREGARWWWKMAYTSRRG